MSNVYIIPLSSEGARRNRCYLCGEPTGSKPLAHPRLKSLYCSKRCIRLALLEPDKLTQPVSDMPARRAESQI